MSENPETTVRGWARYVVWLIAFLALYPLSMGPASAGVLWWYWNSNRKWPVNDVYMLVYGPLIQFDDTLYPNDDSLLCDYCGFCQSFVE